MGTEGCLEIVGLKEEVKALQLWQAQQNGTLQRLEVKLDKLMFWLLTSTAGIVAALAGVLAAILVHG